MNFLCAMVIWHLGLVLPWFNIFSLSCIKFLQSQLNYFMLNFLHIKGIFSFIFNTTGKQNMDLKVSHIGGIVSVA
jgi:hypothetical protein